MREYTSGSRFASAFQKDLERFFRNWDKLPEFHALFIEAFQQAGITLPSSIVGRQSV